MTELQERILKCLARGQEPAQIALECRCAPDTVIRLRRRVYGPATRPSVIRHAEKMRERAGKRHWASILLEREVLRGEMPPEFLPPDAKCKWRRPSA